MQKDGSFLVLRMGRNHQMKYTKDILKRHWTEYPNTCTTTDKQTHSGFSNTKKQPESLAKIQI